MGRRGLLRGRSVNDHDGAVALVQFTIARDIISGGYYIQFFFVTSPISPHHRASEAECSCRAQTGSDNGSDAGDHQAGNRCAERKSGACPNRSSATAPMAGPMPSRSPSVVGTDLSSLSDFSPLRKMTDREEMPWSSGSQSLASGSRYVKTAFRNHQRPGFLAE
jgi:hypothetical protein